MTKIQKAHAIYTQCFREHEEALDARARRIEATSEAEEGEGKESVVEAHKA
jgi:hypothetical protein